MRIDRLVHDLVEHAAVAGDIVQGDEAGAAMDELRTFMFDHVYLGAAARREHAKIERRSSGRSSTTTSHGRAARRTAAAPPGRTCPSASRTTWRA